MILGIHSLLNMHRTRIKRRQAGWGYSLVTWIGFSLMLLAGIYNNGRGPLAPIDLEHGGMVWSRCYHNKDQIKQELMTTFMQE